MLLAKNLLVLALALGLATRAAAQVLPARLTFHLPAEAQLSLNGVPSAQTGGQRVFDTPALEPGYDYAYTVRAELVRAGHTVRVVKTVTFQAGAAVNVDLMPDFARPATDTAASAGLARDEQTVVELTNREREKAGLAPLRVNPQLTRAAKEHSVNMARLDQLSHVLDGKGPSDRVTANGYSFAGLAENCAAGQRTPAEAVSSWMHSPGHRANILNGALTEIGVGIAAAASGGLYYTQVFAQPAKQ